MVKNVKYVELNTRIVYNCFLEYTNFKNQLMEYKRLCCNKNGKVEKAKI